MMMDYYDIDDDDDEYADDDDDDDDDDAQNLTNFYLTLQATKAEHCKFTSFTLNLVLPEYLKFLPIRCDPVCLLHKFELILPKNRFIFLRLKPQYQCWLFSGVRSEKILFC